MQLRAVSFHSTVHLSISLFVCPSPLFDVIYLKIIYYHAIAQSFQQKAFFFDTKVLDYWRKIEA